MQEPTKTTKPSPALLTIDDLAAMVQTSTRQIRNMQARGQIPAPRRIPGLGLRWDPDAVQKWLATV